MVTIDFPEYTGIRCLMMPYVQGEPDSVPDTYAPYREIIASQYLAKGERGFLTIDESPVKAGRAHRGDRAKFGRALHTEAGLRHGIYAWGGSTPTWGSPSYTWGGSTPTWGGPTYTWGSPGWGSGFAVTLDPDVEILLANNLDGSCALWAAEHRNTSADGDIGDCADQYPYADAIVMRAGEVHRIGIFTPHESLPVQADYDRQFLRIVGSGVHGREEYFTVNPLMEV